MMDNGDKIEPSAQTKASDGASLLDRGPGSWLIHYADLIASAVYLIGLTVVMVPIMRTGFNVAHEPTPLMNALRALHGQVPFKDFFPWYGPLYYYPLAGWIGLVGEDLALVKFYFRVITPGLALGLFIFTLRRFRIGAEARLAAVLMYAAVGVETFGLGVRSYLGLAALGVWIAVRGPARPALARVLVFPSILLIFLVSPEIAVYLAPAAAIFIAHELLTLAPARRRPAVAAYAGGLLAAGAAFGSLYYGTDFFPNFCGFLSYSSSNMIWAYGLPLDQVAGGWRLLVFALPPLAALGAAGWTARAVIHNRIADLPLWLPAAAVYGAALIMSAFVRSDLPHGQFALPPALAITALAVQRTAARRRLGFALLLAAGPLILLLDRDAFPYARYQDERRFHAANRLAYGPERLLGIHAATVNPDYQTYLAAVADFSRNHPDRTIAFPLQSLEAYLVGRPALISFDDIYWGNDPFRHDRLLAELGRADSIVLSRFNLLPVYNQQDTDPLFDYIAANFEPAESSPYGIIYERVPAPAPFLDLVRRDPGPIILDRSTSFTQRLDLPAGLSHGWVTLNFRFRYRPGLLQKFSIPLVQARADLGPDELLAGGRQRVRTTPDGGDFRITVPPGSRSLTVSISFPGPLNPRPDQVVITDVRFENFLRTPPVPYTSTFIRKGY